MTNLKKITDRILDRLYKSHREKARPNITSITLGKNEYYGLIEELDGPTHLNAFKDEQTPFMGYTIRVAKKARNLIRVNTAWSITRRAMYKINKNKQGRVKRHTYSEYNL